MYKDKKSTAADHVENAASDFRSGTNELKSAKDSALSSARSNGTAAEFADRAESTVRHLREHARDAGEKVQHFFSHRREDLTQARDTAERTIRSNPLASAAAAFVSGMIIARIFKR